jgi:hypothetical protein
MIGEADLRSGIRPDAHGDRVRRWTRVPLERRATSPDDRTVAQAALGFDG